MTDQAGPKPDLVVGVDFGMTCTGVAYQNLSTKSTTVQWINKWPGRAQAAENKVPTVVVYSRELPTHPTSWGFQSEDLAEQLAPDRVYREWFKVLLDGKKLKEQHKRVNSIVARRGTSRSAHAPEVVEGNNGAGGKDPLPTNVQEVQKWYTDYLRKLYEHIEYKLTPHLNNNKEWRDATVEFLFSVPTTWDPTIVERFRKVIRASGFGTHSAHSVNIDLTEAEAAAVFTARDSPGIFAAGDILLVCDAGGGTTDLSVLRVLEAHGETLRLEQLDVVQGRSIGSTAIDYDFQELVRRRLEDSDKQTALNINILGAAWEMMKSREFQNLKCEVGSPDEPPRFKLPIRGLGPGYTDLMSGIDGGLMSFTREDLRKLFEKQIDKIYNLIDQQLVSIERKFPHDRIQHLVLSGGLGNSGFVHQKLAARYQSENCPWKSAQGMRVRVSPDPQLAVAKGMIVNRVQKLNNNNRSAIGIRCCRASYGALCKEEWNPKLPQHAGIAPEVDQLNGKKYLTNVIEWFIRKGEQIHADEPIVRSYKRRLPLGAAQLEVASTLVVCDLDNWNLPYRLSPDVRHLCDLTTTIPSTDGVLHKDKGYKRILTGFKPRKDHYIRVDFEIMINVGPADLRFELWRNGAKMGGERSIKVDFGTADEIVQSPLSRPPMSPQSLLSSPRNTAMSPQQSGPVELESGLIPMSLTEQQLYSDSERRASYIPFSPRYSTSQPQELGQDQVASGESLGHFGGHAGSTSSVSLPKVVVTTSPAQDRLPGPTRQA